VIFRVYVYLPEGTSPFFLPSSPFPTDCGALVVAVALGWSAAHGFDRFDQRTTTGGRADDAPFLTEPMWDESSTKPQLVV